MVKWVCGSVNYKCEAYLPTKLRMLYEFNSLEDFTHIIVDNNPVHDAKYFEELLKPYPNSKVIPHIPINVNRTSGEHGSGLDRIHEEAIKLGADFLLVEDPDFFWVQKNLLKYFEAEFNNEGYSIIGAPYTFGLPLAAPDFPCAFGAAYRMSDIAGMSFKCHPDQHECLMGRDVGWEIREKLAKSKYLSFSQNDVPQSELIPGEYSFQTILREYHLYGRRIAYHLHRGSFDDGLAKFQENDWKSDRSKDLHKPHEEWVRVREQYCQKYYQELKDSQGFL